jgi:uncharacterized protein YecT (DUF1311 family)
MQIDDGGNDLSITFRTSGKQVRLSAPDKWRRAVLAKDLTASTWVEIMRRGTPAQALLAGDVPELRALFGISESAGDHGADADERLDGAAVSETQEPPEALAEPESPESISEALPEAPTEQPLATPVAKPPPPLRPTPPAKKKSGFGDIVLRVVGGLIVLNIVRACLSSHQGPPAQTVSAPVAVSAAASSTPPDSAPASPTPGQAADAAAADAASAAADAATAAAAAAAATAPPGAVTEPVAPDNNPETQPAAAAPLNGETAAVQPSFDCGRVESVNLKLICATPDLATADQTLAAAYRAALASSVDPIALRNDERTWILLRNRSLPDVSVLRSLYAQRIRQLQELAASPQSAAPQ